MSGDLSRGLNRAEMHIAAFRGRIREEPVWPESDGNFRAALQDRFDFERPMDVADLVSEVVGYIERGIVHVTHPRYFGLFNPPVHPAAVVGDLLAAAYNPQLAAWSHAPNVLELETLTLHRLARVLGLNPDAIMATFTSGGAEANLTAVLAALADAAPDWPSGGVGVVAGRPILYLSEHSHDSFVKIARMTGLGTESLRRVPLRPDLIMDPDAFDQLVLEDEDRGCFPFMVVATAGATATGHVDPLYELADIAADRRLWYHVDAAWGAAAAFSPRLRPLLDGIERANSVTWDAHKWLSVPMSAGMFFCNRPAAVQAAFDVTTAYMPQAVGEETPDPYRVTAQWSRRTIGLKVFMALAANGVSGYTKYIEHQAAMGDVLRDRLGDAGWEVVNRTQLPVVCFTHRMIRSGGVSTGRLLEHIGSRRRVWLSETVLDPGSGPVLRACITSHETRPDDIDVLIDELQDALANA